MVKVWWKLNEMHDAMLEKLGLCCDDCLDEQKQNPCWDGYKQVGMKTMKDGRRVPKKETKNDEVQ